MLWFDGPTIVDQVEWANHAEKWRKSIDTGHGSPDGRDTSPRYYDGTYLKAIDAVHEAEWEKINAWLKKHISISLTDSSTAGVGGRFQIKPTLGAASRRRSNLASTPR